MAQIINNLQALPKQEITVSLDNVLWDIAIIETAGVMSVNITSGGAPTPIVAGWRCVAGQLLIPKNRENGGGNFLFLTAGGDDLPWWESFGTTQLLAYVGAAELAAIRNGN